MRRREFITFLGGASASSISWPLTARAQAPNQVRRIGALNGSTEAPQVLRKEAFLKELQRLGWSEERNLRIDWRYADGDPARMRAYASELIRLNPDVIFAVATQVV